MLHAPPASSLQGEEEKRFVSAALRVVRQVGDRLQQQEALWMRG